MKPATKGVRVVAYVAGGAIATRSLHALGAAFDLVGVVRLKPGRGVKGALRRASRRLVDRMASRRDPVTAVCRELGVPQLLIDDASSEESAARIARLNPDYGCIATFPTRIGTRLLEASGREVLNLHTSLLPRHRGSSPLFWTYFAGDERGGVSVHRATEVLDGGPVYATHAIPIKRGQPVTEIHAQCATEGALLLSGTVGALVDGSADATPQDDADATAAPRVEARRTYSDLQTWSASHTWHFLRGLESRFRDHFVDARGSIAAYQRVGDFDLGAPAHPPGSVTPDGKGWRIWTVDGSVELLP